MVAGSEFISKFSIILLAILESQKREAFSIVLLFMPTKRLRDQTLTVWQYLVPVEWDQGCVRRE